MATAKAATEPSMEEILASIRQIIAEEDAPAQESTKSNSQADIDAAFDTPAASADEIDFDNALNDDDGDEDVLTLSMESAAPEVVDTPEPEVIAELPALEAVAPVLQEPVIPMEPPKVVEPAPVAVMPVAPVIAAPELPPVPVVPQPASVVPPPIPEASASLIDDVVASSVKASFNALRSDMAIASSSTLEGLVTQMLRPMMKEWLDQNLPSTVERLVREEIRRLQGD